MRATRVTNEDRSPSITHEPNVIGYRSAVIDDVSVGERIRERLGKTISKDSERQLKSRAKQKLATLIERRKEEVS